MHEFNDRERSCSPSAESWVVDATHEMVPTISTVQIGSNGPHRDAPRHPERGAELVVQWSARPPGAAHHGVNTAQRVTVAPETAMVVH